ncbi:MAG: PQQ-dependent dehydrogenase, methanol/ethanol family [Acidobacteriaceae bacterium]|nr:PQQ-dependent dehydrogenase, methanol/ethanol family [Acidobacteriaceae bacterium]
MRFISFVLLLAGHAAGQVRYADILKSPSENWLTYHGDYRALRYSPLAQINRKTVANLVPKWTYHMEGARRLEASPIVYDGVMYVTGSNEVDALDARNGRCIWSYRDAAVQEKNVNRGVAILGDSVFFVTGDAYLVALHRSTGAVLWQKQFADRKKGYFATLAPLALEDRIIVGVSGGDSGMRGFVAAFSPTRGDELWRFYTVPAKGEPGAETWGESDTQWGGAATWMTGTYDPGLNTLYWATGNPWPDYYGVRRRGANLYSDSIVALDAATGKLKWYFQFTPHDVHDWDAQSIPVLADLPCQGKTRKLLLHANRNGFYYVLDRETGAFLFAKAFVEKLDWATGVDGKGRPIEVSNMDPTPGGRRVCPSTRGASNWMSPSFNPLTKLLYVPALEQCDRYVATEHVPEPMKNLGGGGGESIPSEPGKFYLRAIDPATGERRWDYPMTGPATMWAGTVATAGGLVFFGDDDGQLVAVDAWTGEDLWHYSMGQLLTASPVTFSIEGKQYVVIAAATDVFAFSLFEPAVPFSFAKQAGN